MAKKRKTKDQKKLADSRHSFTHAKTFATSTSFALKPQVTDKIEAKVKAIPQNAYPYLKRDLSKTTLITLGILIFQAILFMSLKNHIFIIPGLNY